MLHRYSHLLHQRIFFIPSPLISPCHYFLHISSTPSASHVQRLLVRNQEERLNQLSQMTKHVREERKKLNTVSAELKEEAIEECRAVNEAAVRLKPHKDKDTTGSASAAAASDGKSEQAKPAQKSKGKGKGGNKKPSEEKEQNTAATKSVFDPTGPQLTAMIEDLKLRKAIKMDVLIDDNMGIADDDTDDKAMPSSTIAMTARTSLAELDRKRKEKEKNQLMKEDAIAWLDQALETERERDIKDALKYARLAGLEGEMEDGKTFCTTQMFKVCDYCPCVYVAVCVCLSLCVYVCVCVCVYHTPPSPAFFSQP